MNNASFSNIFFFNDQMINDDDKNDINSKNKANIYL
jgi:hypothetical protein